VKLSQDQEDVLKAAARWLKHAPEPTFDTKYILGDEKKVTIGFAHDYPVCAVGGYAGTGKTTILRHMGENHAGIRFVTPTHKAAGVLRGKLPADLKMKVNTYHQLIYLPKPTYTCELSGLSMKALPSCGCEDGDACEHVPQFEPCRRHEACPNADGSSPCKAQEHLEFDKREYLEGHISLIIVDEASMLTEDEVNDIRSYGVPVMLVGDHGQLPPVKAKMNPWILAPKLLLTVNHRQGEESGIPEAAVCARTSGALSARSYGSSVSVLPKSDQRVPGLLERFRPDAKERTVLCQYNRTRAGLNQAFHEQYGPEKLHEGERLMSLQRIDAATVIDPRSGETYGETKIFNGTMATVRRVDSIKPRFIYAVLELDNDWQGKQGVHVLVKMAAEQLGSPDKLSLDRKPRDASCWDFCYAITVHRAQGSEFSKVIAFQETVGDRRSLYTAVTRAKDALIVLN
jgi:exodeoxyribonuclease-5